MNKPTQNFKMNKQSKRLMATIVDKQARTDFKQNMIQAQLQSEIVPAKSDNKSK